MTRLVRLAVTLLLATVMSLPILAASAQDATEETIFDNPGLMEGIQYGVAREWNSSADLSTPPAEGESLVYLAGGLVYEFDTEDNADLAFNQLKEALATYVSEEFGMAADAFTQEELDDDTFAYHGLIEDGDERVYFKYVVAVEDEYVLVSVSATSDEAASGIANDLIEYMEDQDDDVSGLGEFNEDGTSTGGLWDFFPAEDDSILEGLGGASDNVVYPVEEDAA
jgi:hypothetical protein